MSMKTWLVATFCWFANTRTMPFCSTTNQRELSPGACNIATGSRKVRAGNARCTDSVELPVTRGGATQLKLFGRCSRPDPGGGGGGGGGVGSDPPPPQESSAAAMQIGTARRTTACSSMPYAPCGMLPSRYPTREANGALLRRH